LGQGSVWAAVVVFVDERVELGLEFGEGRCFGVLNRPGMSGDFLL
jgi:hypothetical protein